MKLVEKANEEKLAAATATSDIGDTAGAKSGVGAAIQRLEEQLSK